MPTLSQHSASSPGPQPHRHREVAESFGIDPQRYDRARPRYPDALITRIIATSPGRDVLDIGCGTGIEARQFQEAGSTVLGIDPDDRMAEFARGTGVEVETCTFEAWDPAGRTFDTVVAGQAWHWVDPVAGPAKAAQVLRPGGRIAVFGHAFDAPGEVTRALAAAYAEVAPESPFHRASTQAKPALETYREMFDAAAGGFRRSGRFDEPDLWRFDWEQTYTRDQWLDHLPTTGLLTRLAPDQLAVVLDRVGTAIDAIGGGFTMPYTTLAATAARTG